MTKKEKKKKPPTLEDIQKLSAEQQKKYEIAKELGLFDKILTDGWGALSATESGRIGGILAQRNKKK